MPKEERRMEEQTTDHRPEGSAGEPEGGGLVDRAVDKARERGLVDESMIEKAREKGLIDKANEAVDKLKNRFGGK